MHMHTRQADLWQCLLHGVEQLGAAACRQQQCLLQHLNRHPALQLDIQLASRDALVSACRAAAGEHTALTLNCGAKAAHRAHTIRSVASRA